MYRNKRTFVQEGGTHMEMIVTKDDLYKANYIIKKISDLNPDIKIDSIRVSVEITKKILEMSDGQLEAVVEW